MNFSDFCKKFHLYDLNDIEIFKKILININIDDDYLKNCEYLKNSQFLKKYECLNLIGSYYYLVEKNYDLMKKYYLMAVKKNNDNAMYNLGHYYQCIEINYDLMKKYYLIAIEQNNSYSMINLGYYYQYIEKNYDLMKKYYLMAIEQNNNKAMHNLGNYYMNIEKNYDLMIKYYFMAIELNNIKALNLIKYYILYNYIDINDLLTLCIKINAFYSMTQKFTENNIYEYYSEYKNLYLIQPYLNKICINKNLKMKLKIRFKIMNMKIMKNIKF